jgi:hypothetical protein
VSSPDAKKTTGLTSASVPFFFSILLVRKWEDQAEQSLMLGCLVLATVHHPIYMIDTSGHALAKIERGYDEVNGVPLQNAYHTVFCIRWELFVEPD